MGKTVTSLRDEFLEAWRRWDERSGDDARCRAMEEACRPIAAQLDMTNNTFRARLCAWRRTGRNRERSLRATESGKIPEEIAP